MAASEDFSEYYQSISDTELLEILDNPQDYQPEALEAANKELASRQLTEQAIEEARLPLIAKKRNQEKEREQLKAVETKIKTVGNRFFDTINPIQSGIPSAEKIIRFIVIVFGGMFLFELFHSFSSSEVYIHDFSNFPIQTAIILLPQLLLGLAIFLFWRRKSIGWTLLTVFLSISLMLVIWGIYQTITWKPSGISHLDIPFAPTPISTLIVQLVFLAASIYVLARPAIREQYAISKDHMIATIGIPGLVAFVLMYFVANG